MSRGNRKSTIFEDDVDRRVFLEVIAETTRRYGIRIFELCEMGNHYHALLDAPRDNLSGAMRHLNAGFAQASNRRHGRTGHLFEERFRSVVVQWRSYLRRASRYVVRNPVRAKLVATPACWPWSTYRATAGLEAAPSWLHTNWLQDAFEVDSQEAARDRYREYVNGASVKDKPPSTAMLSWGSRGFEHQLRALLDDRIKRADLPRAWVSLGRPKLPEVFHTLSRSRKDRDQLIEVAHVTHGYTFKEISEFLRLHPSTVSAAFRRVSGEPRRP